MIVLEQAQLPSLRVQVVEPTKAPRAGWEGCELGRNINFSSASLESYLFAGYEHVVVDSLVVAAAVEYCDRRRRRSATGWSRQFHLQIPVHCINRWSAEPVLTSLTAALSFLTGDVWNLEFVPRKSKDDHKSQGALRLPQSVQAVIPFSKGLDSRSVAGLMANSYKDTLFRVRVGTEKSDKIAGLKGRRQPFVSVPYEVSGAGRSLPETSARTRGFKFAIISAIAAHLSGAKEIIVPESGQGALGPALLPVGHAYEDYRNHPLFMRRMELFIQALFDRSVRYSFPRLWFTKGETLRAFVAQSEEGESWVRTWSCWQQSRQASVAGKQRQCGICAACMLRRLSIHAAGLEEQPQTYVWEDLRSVTFEGGAAAEFESRRITKAMREYAIAGALHMEHLADLTSGNANERILSRAAFQVGRAEGIEAPDALRRLRRMLDQHAQEWSSFRAELGPNSFVKKWLRAA